MDATNILQQIGESLGSTATVKAVFGEPIRSEGRTVIPVAKVAYGFGGGFGSGQQKTGEPKTGEPKTGEPEVNGRRGNHGEGGGGGGGVRAFPAGALEITAQGTRFIPFPDLRLAGAAFAAGLVFGGWMLRRKLR